MSSKNHCHGCGKLWSEESPNCMFNYHKKSEPQRTDSTKSNLRYWLSPPELFHPLAREFNFDFDPCPYPLPKNYDGLKSEWGNMNYVNPIFRVKDSKSGKDGPTAWARKAIEQQRKGKSSFLTLPTQSYVNMLLEAGAELRSLGRVKWLEVKTKEPMKSPSSITGFYLRGLSN
jgi:hypothetical protein